MKVILKFDLSEGEDSADAWNYKRCWHGPAYHGVLNEFDQWLRARAKHGDDNEMLKKVARDTEQDGELLKLLIKDDRMKAVMEGIYEEIRSKLWEFLNEAEVDLD